MCLHFTKCPLCFLKIVAAQGRGPRPRGGPGAWGPGRLRGRGPRRPRRRETRAAPSPAGLRRLGPESPGLQGPRQQPWQGRGNLSPASSARPRGLCFSHGPRWGAVGTRQWMRLHPQRRAGRAGLPRKPTCWGVGWQQAPRRGLAGGRRLGGEGHLPSHTPHRSPACLPLR